MLDENNNSNNQTSQTNNNNSKKDNDANINIIKTNTGYSGDAKDDVPLAPPSNPASNSNSSTVILSQKSLSLLFPPFSIVVERLNLTEAQERELLMAGVRHHAKMRYPNGCLQSYLNKNMFIQCRFCSKWSGVSIKQFMNHKSSCCGKRLKSLNRNFGKI